MNFCLRRPAGGSDQPEWGFLLGDIIKQQKRGSDVFLGKKFKVEMLVDGAAWESLTK